MRVSCLYRQIHYAMISNRYYCTKNFNFKEHIVQIQTCGELYKTWKKEKVFWKLPESNLTFEVKFIDTRPNNSDNSKVVPTVLALHGAPGSWKDYTLIASHLHEQGCRVIAPSFPDFHVYKPGIFRHTFLEKSEYIKDFLSAISVSHIELLICHSGSVYPGIHLCLRNELKIKSLALLNPATFNLKEMNATKNFLLLKTFVKAAENPVGLKIIKTIGSFVMRNIMNVPVRVENILDPLLSATTMVYGNADESKEKFLLVSKKLPLLYIFSENDVLISKKPSYDLAKLFGVSVSDIFIYNYQGQLVQKGTTTPMVKVLAFQEGSHYAFLKHPEIVNKELVDFLKIQK